MFRKSCKWAKMLLNELWVSLNYLERYTFRPFRMNLRFPTAFFDAGACATEHCRFAEGVRIGVNCSISSSSIGRYTYVGNDTKICNCNIGAFCSIGPGVYIGLGTHPLHFVSTHPFFYHSGNLSSYHLFPSLEYQERLPIRIGNDVWIGARALVMDGVEIGDGAVLGAGSILTHSLEPYQVACGIPAKVIKNRFEPDQVVHLLKLQWWKQSDQWLLENRCRFRSVEELLCSKFPDDPTMV